MMQLQIRGDKIGITIRECINKEYYNEMVKKCESGITNWTWWIEPDLLTNIKGGDNYDE
jgi:hypothetical protein